MTATTRTARAEQTRRLLLDTAERLFARDGYDATSLQMIADEMGVAKAAVYYYFRTKAGILQALALEPLAQMRAVLEGTGNRGTRDEQVRSIVAAWVELIIDTRGITSLKLNDPAVQRELQLTDEIETMVQRGLQLIFGPAPSAEEYVSYYLLLSMREVTSRVSHLSDDDLREALTATGLRLLGHADAPRDRRSRK